MSSMIVPHLPYAILLLQVAATFSMVGLIWFVQVVHYPLFNRIGPDIFPKYESEHQRLTTLVVAPPMFVEFGTAFALLWIRPPEVSSWLAWAGLGLVVSLWLLTGFVQVPQHRKLAQGYDATVQRRLVIGNWFRTTGWSFRGLLVLAMLVQVLGKDIATRG